MARSLLGALRRRGGLIVVAGVLAAGVALVLSLLSTPMYRAEADVLVDTAERSIDAEAIVAGSAELRDAVRGVVGDEPDLDVTVLDGAEVLVFSATSSNADNAALAANTHATAYIDQHPGDAELIEPATAPTDPYEPETLRNTLLALGAGLLIGLVAALVVNAFDPTIRSRRRLQDVTGVPNLAVIPRVPLGEQRPDELAALGDPNSVEAESYRTLRTAFDFLTVESGDKVVLVTSPRPGEGKSSVAANLALTAAQGGRNVVLIDGDLRKPQLHRSFAVRNDCGLSSILTGRAPLSRAVTRLDAERRLVILPAGPPPPDPAELLSTNRLGKTIQALAKAADLVVIDAPPVLPVTDSTILAQHCDAVLLAATVGLSDRREWSEMMDRLAVVRAKVIGTVLSRPDARIEATTTYHYAPTAPPANWWVTQASEAERAAQPDPDDVTTVMPRDPVDELIAPGATHADDGATAASASSAAAVVDTITWAKDDPADGDGDGSGDDHGDEGGADGRLERTRSGDGNGGDSTG